MNAELRRPEETNVLRGATKELLDLQMLADALEFARNRVQAHPL